MLKIGEFSALTGISINMLRNYDKIGLLAPKNIDWESGYRYYDREQILAANRIQVLKRLGFSLKEIMDFNQNGDLNANARKAVLKKTEEKEREIEALKEQLMQLRNVAEELACDISNALSVTLKVIPSYNAITLREVIGEFSDEGILWNKLFEECQRLNVHEVQNGWRTAITHSISSDFRQIDVEVRTEIIKTGLDNEKVKFVHIPECTAAVIAFKGEYFHIGEINEYAYKWIEKNGYILCGECFSLYHVSPYQSDNSKDYITELFYPVKKLF